MRKWILVACLAAASAIFTVPAEASTSVGWGSSSIIDNYPAFDAAPQVGVDGAGDATAIWTDNGVNYGIGGILTADHPAGGSWSNPVKLDQRGVDANVAVDPAGDAVATWLTDDQPGSSSTYTLVAATRSAGGQWSAPVTLGGAYFERGPAQSLAVDAEGDATVVWLKYDQVHGSVSLATTSRQTGGAWSAPHTLDSSPPGTTPVAVAVGAAGDAAAAWVDVDPTTNASILKLASKPAGGSWSAPHTLDSQINTAAALGIDQAGDITALWSSQDVNSSGGTVVATRPAGGSWSSPVLLDSNGFSGGTVAVDPAGDVAAMWSGSGGLDAASRPAGGSWSQPVTIDSAGGYSSGSYLGYSLGIDNAGDVTAAWLHDDASAQKLSVMASSRGSGGPWTSPVALDSDTGLYNDSSAPDVVLGVGTAGDATAAWLHLTYTPGQPGVINVWSASTLQLQKPAATAAPNITGTPTVGSQLTTDSGQWSGCDNRSCTYAVSWMLCPQGGGGCSTAQGDTYTVGSGDIGLTIASCVVATNSAGSSPPDCGTAVGPVTDTSGGGGGGSGGGGGGGPERYGAGGQAVGVLTVKHWDDSRLDTVPWTDVPEYASGSSEPIEFSCDNGANPPSSDGIVACRAAVTSSGIPQVEWDATPYQATGSGGVSVSQYYDYEQLPTDCPGPAKCTYDVNVDMSDSSGGFTSRTFSYVVDAPPTAAQQLKTVNGASLDLGNVLSGSPAVSSGGQFCALTTGLPPGCARTIFDPSGNPLVTISGDHGGEIIASGAYNIIASGAYNIIAAGAGNIINAGAYNIAQVVDDSGKTVAIIAAGSGNLKGSGDLKIIAAGSGNITVDAAQHIIAAGAGNIIAAGAYNIIGAGAGNIIASGAYNIIAAGAGNLVPQSGFSFGPTTALVNVNGDPGIGSLSLATPGGAGFAPDGATVARRRTLTIASGRVVFTRPGTAGMQVLLTHKGKQLIQRMAKRNAALARKHKRRLKLKIALTYTFAPVHGKAITVSRKLTITPKLASKHHGRR